MTTTQIQKRNGKSQRLKVIKAGEGYFAVESTEGKIFYTVSIADNGTTSCSCADFIRNHKNDDSFRCKHILAVHDCDGVYEESLLLDRKHPKLDGRFIKNISGRDFCLYAGLLDYAHQKGLLKLECSIIQYPCEANGHEAICTAVAEAKNGEVFVDIGDANSKNTNKMIAPHIIRMASTRAKARCLRDMCNIGMTCLEELGDLKDVIGLDTAETRIVPQKAIAKQLKNADPAFSDAKKTVPETKHDEKTETKAAKTAQTAVHERPAKTDGNGSKGNDTAGKASDKLPKISEAQRRAMLNLAKRRGHSSEELDTMVKNAYGISIDGLNTQQASAFIRQIQSAA
jgi:hypothetical protein